MFHSLGGVRLLLRPLQAVEDEIKPEPKFVPVIVTSLHGVLYDHLGKVRVFCGGYLVDVAGIYLSPGFAWSLSAYPATLAGLAELPFLLWLLIVGAKVPRRDRYAQATADALVRA
jgi:hypothetical protein